MRHRQYPRFVKTETIFESGEKSNAPSDLVSVCMSSYNYARFVAKGLDSIKSQTHEAIEIIVVDDLSPSDNSVEVIAQWMNENQGRFFHTLLLKHVRNQGLAEARNSGIERALGDFFFVIDSDNQIYPRCISRLHEVVSSGDWAAAYCQLEFFDGYRGLGMADVFAKENFLSRRGNFVDAMAMVSKSVWEQSGGYIDTGGYEDYDFWLRLLELGVNVAYVPEILCRYRTHKRSMSEDIKSGHVGLIVELARRHPWIEDHSQPL